MTCLVIVCTISSHVDADSFSSHVPHKSLHDIVFIAALIAMDTTSLNITEPGCVSKFRPFSLDWRLSRAIFDQKRPEGDPRALRYLTIARVNGWQYG